MSLGLKLYDIPALFREWERRVDAQGGEITPELERELDRITLALDSKVDAIAALIREREHAAEAARVEARDFAAKARGCEAEAHRLRAYLLHHLKAMGLDAGRGARFRASVVKNGAPTISWPVERGEPPEGFRKITVELDRNEAQAAYRNGYLPEGFTVEHGEHLVIR